MKKRIIKNIAILVLAVSSAYANATSYDFSYTFFNGKVLSGSLTGTLQSDLDRVFVSSINSVTYDGIVFPGTPAFPASSISSFSDVVPSLGFTPGSLQPVVSFSGTNIDIYACSSGETSLCNDNSDYAFAINTTATGTAVNSIFGRAAGLLFGSPFNNFITSNWSLNESATSSVPVPGAAWLFASSLVGLFGLRRKNV